MIGLGMRMGMRTRPDDGLSGGWTGLSRYSIRQSSISVPLYSTLPPIHLSIHPWPPQSAAAAVKRATVEWSGLASWSLSCQRVSNVRYPKWVSCKSQYNFIANPELPYDIQILPFRACLLFHSHSSGKTILLLLRLLMVIIIIVIPTSTTHI